MAVDREVTREVLRGELAAVEALSVRYGWEVTTDLAALKVLTKMRAHNSDLFVVEADLENYKEWPPLFEFFDPVSGERGVRGAYPASSDSFFHPSGPCICAPFNRKAYKCVVPTGPHGEWNFGDWMTSKANGYDWSRVTTLGDMLGMIQCRLIFPDLYRGRMA